MLPWCLCYDAHCFAIISECLYYLYVFTVRCRCLHRCALPCFALMCFVLPLFAIFACVCMGPHSFLCHVTSLCIGLSFSACVCIALPLLFVRCIVFCMALPLFANCLSLHYYSSLMLFVCLWCFFAILCMSSPSCNVLQFFACICLRLRTIVSWQAPAWNSNKFIKFHKFNKFKLISLLNLMNLMNLIN